MTRRSNLQQQTQSTGAEPAQALQRAPFARDTGTQATHEAAPAAVQVALAAPGQPLEPPTRAAMEAHFGFNFSNIRIHSDAQAAASARSVHALAYTVGRDLVFAAGQYAPQTFAGRRLLAHELAHAVQQSGATWHGAALALGQPHDRLEHEARAAVQTPGASLSRISTARIQRQPDNLGAYPEAERRRVRVSDIAIALPSDLADMFTAPRGSTTGNPGTSYGVNGTVVFGSTVPTSPPILRRGLQSVGGWLSGQTNALPINTTITVELNLTPFGGTNARYRFTYLEHTERRTTANVMLIEQIGAAVAAPAAVTLPTSGTFAVRGRNFRLGSGWNDTRYALLRRGLEISPDAALDAIAGITFRRTAAGTGNEAGHFDGENDVIEIHSNAFHDSASTATAARFGGDDPAVRVIAHEIGHAADLRRLHQAWTTFDSGGQTSAGRTTLLGQRSASGSRWVDPGGGAPYTISIAQREARNPEFRQAAITDGAVVNRSGTGQTGGITSYADTDWQEAFAEAYSLYVTDPDLLLQLRPNLHRYFTRRFPQPAPAATGAGGTGGGTAP